MGLLLAVWTVPMRSRRQEVWLRIAFVMDAWASLDVAVVVMAVACSEFARLATFLVYEGNFAAPCTIVKDMTKQECMDIKLITHPSLVLVFLTGLACIVVPKVVMRSAWRCLEARCAMPLFEQRCDYSTRASGYNIH